MQSLTAELVSSYKLSSFQRPHVSLFCLFCVCVSAYAHGEARSSCHALPKTPESVDNMSFLVHQAKGELFSAALTDNCNKVCTVTNYSVGVALDGQVVSLNCWDSYGAIALHWLWIEALSITHPVTLGLLLVYNRVSVMRVWPHGIGQQIFGVKRSREMGRILHLTCMLYHGNVHTVAKQAGYRGHVQHIIRVEEYWINYCSTVVSGLYLQAL
jgi:hypothetical protein